MKQTSKFEIGLDFRMAANTGIGTYLRGITEGFRRNKEPAASRLALFSANSSLSGSFSKIFFDAPIYSLREQWQYPERVKLCRLWHAPHYNIPFFKSKTKLIVTVHDIIHWIYRKQLNPLQRIYAEGMLKRAVQSADHILTVSEFSKKDLIQYLGARPEQISVVYNGVSSDFFPHADEQLEKEGVRLKQKYRLPDFFFLYVGLLKSHKNVLRLIRVFLELHAKSKLKSGLVIIGSGAEHSPEIKLLRDAQDKVVYLPKIEYGELPTFYNQARALVHPSLYEGFGLTVLEALACGTPVLTTSRASLPEVGGNAARYINGEDETEMAQALEEWDAEEGLKHRLHDACLKQACKFSWEKAATETAAIYEKILK